MSDALLQAIEQRLAERGLAGLGTVTHEMRLRALDALLANASRGEVAKERLDALDKLFEKVFENNPQFAEWAAQNRVENPPPMPEEVDPLPNDALSATSDPKADAPHRNSRELEFGSFESEKAMLLRQQRESADRTEPAIEPAALKHAEPAPEPEWYANGRHKPGLRLANRLKRLLGPKPEPGDGGWMVQR